MEVLGLGEWEEWKEWEEWEEWNANGMRVPGKPKRRTAANAAASPDRHAVGSGVSRPPTMPDARSPPEAVSAVAALRVWCCGAAVLRRCGAVFWEAAVRISSFTHLAGQDTANGNPAARHGQYGERRRRRVPHAVPGAHPCLRCVFMQRAARRFDPHTKDHNRHGLPEGQTRFFSLCVCGPRESETAPQLIYIARHGSRPLFDHQSQRC
jgi:hypothetical protein